MVGPLSHRRALPRGGYFRLSRQSALTTLGKQARRASDHHALFIDPKAVSKSLLLSPERSQRPVP